MAVTETLLNEFFLSIECHSESLENSTMASRRATSEAMPVLTRFWYVVLVANPDIYMSCFTGIPGVKRSYGLLSTLFSFKHNICPERSIFVNILQLHWSRSKILDYLGRHFLLESSRDGYG